MPQFSSLQSGIEECDEKLHSLKSALVNELGL
jgi:hypothetical protein